MRDNQAKHRQLAKERAKMERKQASRRESGSALVVCEGKCTEPFYLRGVLQYLGINEASVETLEGQSDTHAVAIVERASQRFEQVPRDRVFIVIDAEQEDLVQALKLCEIPLQQANPKKGLIEVKIEPIVSTPCFETWLLLHFRYCDQPFSCYADVLPELLVNLPSYFKADPRIFQNVGGGEGLERAMLHTAKLRESMTQMGSNSPATNMDRLIEALRAIAPVTQ